MGSKLDWTFLWNSNSVPQDPLESSWESAVRRWMEWVLKWSTRRWVNVCVFSPDTGILLKALVWGLAGFFTTRGLGSIFSSFWVITIHVHFYHTCPVHHHTLNVWILLHSSCVDQLWTKSFLDAQLSVWCSKDIYILVDKITGAVGKEATQVIWNQPTSYITPTSQRPAAYQFLLFT